MTFEELLHQYQAEILRYLIRLTNSSDWAEDLLQETFLKAFRSLPSLNSHSNARAWLYRIATNTALDHFKRDKIARAHLDSNGLDALEAPAGSKPSEPLDQRRLARNVMTKIFALPPRQKVALILQKLEGMKYTEIARSLNCSEQTARAHVFQAMKKLRQSLKRWRRETEVI